MFKVPEEYRFTDERHMMGSTAEDGNNGVFEMRLGGGKGRGAKLRAKMIASDGGGWEHVSVTLNRNRCPTWEEMCKIKDLFWDGDDAVIQIHPLEEDYISNHDYCLHMWRPSAQKLPLPPAWMVGFKELDEPCHAEVKQALHKQLKVVNAR